MCSCLFYDNLVKQQQHLVGRLADGCDATQCVRVPRARRRFHRAGEDRRESRHQRERLVRERVQTVGGRPRSWPVNILLIFFADR